MKRLTLLTAVIAALGLSTVRIASADYCYECYTSEWPPCMDCWHPVVWGHTSCIPYCNGTCSVGAPCIGGLRHIQMSPEGTVLASASAEPTQNAGAVAISYSRTCLGLITARHYPQSAAANLRESTRRIVV